MLDRHKDFAKRQTLLVLSIVATIVLAPDARTQGVLTLTPGRVLVTSAGNGTAGLSGDNVSAASATLARPSAVAYDAEGNLFLADSHNHVIREVFKRTGYIVTLAGIGAPGFSGDGGAASAAQLDTPTGVAVDGAGNLYIADSHNHRVRKVSGGVITTVAGTGIPGFSGDGAAATQAQLSLPQGVAVDSNGIVYIADTNNQRVRVLSGRSISTLAGNGDQGFMGDGGAATSAQLDAPTSIAVGSGGTVYVADKHNHRIRSIVPSGIISTVAGSGPPAFSGNFGGDGATATSAVLSRPSGVSVDIVGNLYIADTDNQRVRTVSNGLITTLAGSGAQGFSGDGGALLSATLDTPNAIAVDADGNFTLSDGGNNRLRAAANPTIKFDSTQIGNASTIQTITVTNNGNAPLTRLTAAFEGPFANSLTGTCSSSFIVLTAGASCTVDIKFTPVQTGSVSGAVAFSGPGVARDTVLLAGTGLLGSSMVTLTASSDVQFADQNVTFTAMVRPTGSGVPSGSISFFNGNTPIGSAQALANGSAAVTVAFKAGTYPITAVYSGDANLAGVTSPVLTQVVSDFGFSVSPSSAAPVGVSAGDDAIYSFSASPLNGPFTFPIRLSVTGLPPSATAVLSPDTLQLGGSAMPFSLTIHTAKKLALGEANEVIGKGGLLLSLLAFPFAGRLRGSVSAFSPRAFRGLLAFASLGALLGMLGCGSGYGSYKSPRGTYTVTVVATAQNMQGSMLQRISTVQLNVQ